MDHVHKYNEEAEELENEMIDRLVVFMGRMGVGKTSLFGCYQGNENLQRLQLAYSRIKAAYRAMTCFYEIDKRTVEIVGFGFKCYDTQGLPGNPTVEETILSLYHFFLQRAL
jgi:GTPase SAR1 family protein